MCQSTVFFFFFENKQFFQVLIGHVANDVTQIEMLEMIYKS
jgi:hypothetical protein